MIPDHYQPVWLNSVPGQSGNEVGSVLVTHLYSLLVFFSFHNSLNVDAGQVDVLRSKCTHFHYLLHLGREGGREGGREYEDLVETGRRNGYDTSTVTLEVGSRGFLNPEGFKHLFSSLERCSSKNRHHFLQDVSRKAILGSHRIWTLRNSLFLS